MFWFTIKYFDQWFSIWGTCEISRCRPDNSYLLAKHMFTTSGTSYLYFFVCGYVIKKGYELLINLTFLYIEFAGIKVPFVLESTLYAYSSWTKWSCVVSNDFSTSFNGFLSKSIIVILVLLDRKFKWTFNESSNWECIKTHIRN